MGIDRTTSSLPMPLVRLKFARSRFPHPPRPTPFETIPEGWVPLHQWGIGLWIARPRRDKSVRVLVELLTGRIGRSLDGCFGTFGQAVGTAWLLRADGSDHVTLAFLAHPPGAGGQAAQASLERRPWAGRPPRLRRRGDCAPRKMHAREVAVDA
jgi:hypothetical protein